MTNENFESKMQSIKHNLLITMGESLILDICKYLEIDSVVTLGTVSNKYMYESLYALKYNNFLPSRQLDEHDNIDINEELFNLPQDMSDMEVEKFEIYGHKKAIRLIKMGANVNYVRATEGYPESDEGSLLSEATLFADVKYLELLLKHGADINIKDSISFTPLMVLARIYRVRGVNDIYDATIRFLLENGSDVNILDDYGNTALMVGLANNSSRFYSLLIEYGTNLDIINNRGRNAMQLRNSVS